MAIESFSELHDLIQGVKGKNTIFRGVRKASHDLIPAIGRCEPVRKGADLFQMEKRLLRLFKESARAYLDSVPQDNLEWLTLAQHHGLPTRLLDWTYNPLAAAFFAVEEEYDGESAIYVFWGGSTIGTDRPDPFELEKVKRFRPSHIAERISAQSGLFTVHPEPQKAFQHGSLEKWNIAGDARREMKKVLYKYGVIRGNLFPGLDGIATDLKWLETKAY
jgi:hypothetical protein